MTVVYADVGGTNTRVWNVGKGKITELIIGLRGVWTPSEKSTWKRKLHRFAPSITVLSDIELAHRLAFGNRPGIVLSAGTGSIAFGRNSSGKTARAGGLGPLLGDEGSGFWIGREYLKALYLKDGNLNRLRRYALSPHAIAKIAGLAKKVLRDAGRKPHSMERKIIIQAQRHLRGLIRDVSKKLGQKNNPPIHLTGGLFQNNFFKKSFLRRRPGNS